MALLTQSQVEAVLTAAVVADLTASDSAVVTTLLDQASDWLQEYAVGAGITLTSGTMTASLVRRGAIAFAHFAATRTKKYRDAQGRTPFHVEYEAVAAEMEAWSKRVRPLSMDAAYEGPVVLSEDSRGWNAD